MMKLSMLNEALGKKPSFDAIEAALNLPFKASSGASQAKKIGPNYNQSGVLVAALNYHKKHMSGQRWPALEQAFVKRANTFSGLRGDYVRPRMLLFRYLNNIREPWSLGKMMAEQVLVAIAKGRLNSRQVGRLMNNGDVYDYVKKTYGDDMLRVLASKSKCFDLPNDKWADIYKEVTTGTPFNTDLIDAMSLKSDEDYYRAISDESFMPQNDEEYFPEHYYT